MVVCEALTYFRRPKIHLGFEGYCKEAWYPLMTEFHDLALLSLQPKTRGTRHGLRGAEYESCCEDQFHRGKANAFGAKRRDGGMIAGRWIEVADKVR